LPAGMSWWQRWPLAAVGSADDWHQLDHYTAVVIALGRDLAPVAVTFQQHNYLRTYVVNDGLAMPRDGRLEVDVAIGSNELYPHRAGRQKRRAVSFMTADSLGYLITGRDRPMAAADDVTEPAVEIDYRLAYLPPADAFYSFQGRLGERRSLPGRDGPPGADYNTLPALKPMATQMLAFFWREADPGDLSRMRPILAAGGPYERLAEVQAAAFREALARARGQAGGS
jgi:hypothetical protein